MSKWTPGKWVQITTEEGEERVVAEGFVVAKCDTFNPFDSEQAANARLIAEAPAMAELLLSIVNNGRVSNEELADAQALLERINK